MTDYLFTGPTDSILLLANLNFWGLFMTFLTMLMQFKSAHYEVVKAGYTSDDIETAFPYSTWYKKNGLTTLQIAQSINLIVCVAFWQSYVEDGHTFRNFDYTFSSFNAAALNLYIIIRLIVLHNFPLLVTTLSIFLANVIFLESDWWLDMQTAILYLFINYTIV